MHRKGERFLYKETVSSYTHDYISFPFNRKEMSGASEASSLSIPYDTSKRASLSLLRSHCLWALPTRVSVSPLNESLQDPSPMCQNNTVLISPLTKKLKKKKPASFIQFSPLKSLWRWVRDWVKIIWVWNFR